MPDNPITIFPDWDFGIRHSVDTVPDNDDFILHNHNDIYEIVR